MELIYTTDKYNIWKFSDNTWNVSIKGDTFLDHNGSYKHLDSILKLKGINSNELVKV